MKNKLLIFWLFLGLFLAFPVAVQAQVVVEKSQEIITISGKQYYMHHVKKGETLYSISHAYQVTEQEILQLNPEINDLGLQAEMVIGIPVLNENNEQTTQGYVVYTVEESEKTKRLLRRLGVSEEDFQRLNPSVGSRVTAGQKVLIPSGEILVQDTIKPHVPDTIHIQTTEPIVDTIVEDEKPTGEYYLPEIRPDTCYPSVFNADRYYQVALLVPLYLDNVEGIETSKEKAEKSKNSRALKFLQFYEGFMMAADSLTQYKGLNLDLRVIDVHENVATAQAAVNILQNEPVDLIIGPFFSKSFAVVEEFALSRNIPVVNPLSVRESVIVDAPNVIKLKPSPQSMVYQLADLISLNYPNAKVTLITDDNASDDEIAALMEQVLDSVVSPEVQLSHADMLDLIARESARRKMGKRQLSTLEVEGQIFSTKALSENPEGTVFFENHFQRITFSSLSDFTSDLSSARDNVLVAYGKDIVFATKILNTVNKSVQKYPITLIGLPNWSEFDNLLVPNLLNMNAIYFDDHFVDYNDSLTLQFVDDFREKYRSEPDDYAFEGFDVGWYFLNSLMSYGPCTFGCLPYEHLPLIHTRYYFTKKRYEDGMENRYWNIYQYDNNAIELKPIWIYPKEEE